MIFIISVSRLEKMIEVVYFPSSKHIDNASEYLKLSKMYEEQEGKIFNKCRHDEGFVKVAKKYSEDNCNVNLYIGLVDKKLADFYNIYPKLCNERINRCEDACRIKMIEDIVNDSSYEYLEREYKIKEILMIDFLPINMEEMSDESENESDEEPDNCISQLLTDLTKDNKCKVPIDSDDEGEDVINLDDLEDEDEE